MFQRAAPPADYPPFATLPVRYISGGNAARRLAVYVSGRFTVNQPPLICVPGFSRNMTDFTDFIRHYRTTASVDWPIVLVDLIGRGRSSYLRSPDAYSAVTDAHDLSNVARALGISSAVFVGQGHGGQVVMALAAQHPGLIAGAVLINSGPNANPRGLMRLRSNLEHVEGMRANESARQVLRQILATDYPGLPEATLDALAARSHFTDKGGRLRGLFDPALLKFLEGFAHDDEFVPQWHLFDALASVPLMLVRSQLTDRLQLETFNSMIDRRPDAMVDRFVGEGSPALLNNEGEVGSIADFVMQVGGSRRRWPFAA